MSPSEDETRHSNPRPPSDSPNTGDADETRLHTGPGATPGLSMHPLPKTIGRYRIIRKLGEGGMGVVYEAEQENPQRKVAVKVVKGGRMIDQSQVRMFQREVDTLARLSHPDIGGIFESGCTEDGLHFFAMELIYGKTLDVYLNDRTAPLDAAEIRFRLTLFHKIADAVHYAHQRGVIHRDLKPSNIIVAEAGGTRENSGSLAGLPVIQLPGIKILDFGLARITEGDIDNASMATEVGVIKGTLAYMSPEQAVGRSEEIDVRTDVYALGIILFEMLSGQRPYDVSQRSLPDAIRVIAETRPQSLRAANAKLASLDADIETIVQKALEKEVERRYDSAAELSGDVVRYLTSQPILARPPSTIYQLRKLVSRHRVPAALVGLMLGLLVVFAVGMSFLYTRASTAEHKATREAKTATQALKFMTGMFEGVDPSHALGNVITAREVLDRGAKQVKEELAAEPEIRSSLMVTMGQVYGSLGLDSVAKPLLDEALARRRELFGEADERTLESAAALAKNLLQLGDFLKATTLMESSLSPFDGKKGAKSQIELAARTTLADCYRNLGRREDAKRVYLETLSEQRTTLGNEDSDTLRTITNLSIVYADKGEYPEAEKLNQEVLAVQVAKHGQDHPETLAAKVDLSLLYSEQGRFDDARKLLQETIESCTRVAGPEHRDTLIALGNYSVLLQSEGKFDDAMKVNDQVLAIQTRTLGPRHPATLLTKNNRVALLQAKEQYAEADALVRELYEEVSQVLGPDHTTTLLLANNKAMSEFHLGRYEEAERQLKALYETYLRLYGNDSPWTANVHENYANALYRLGRIDEVLTILRDVLDVRTRALGESHTATSRTRSNLAVVLKSQGKFEESQKILESELKLQLALSGPDHVDVSRVRLNLASALSGQKKYDDALVHLRETLRIHRKTFGERETPVAETLKEFAVTLWRAKQLPEAEKAIAESLAIRREKLGNDAPETLLSLYSQAQIVAAAGRNEEAIKLAESCFDSSVRTKLTRYPLARESARLVAELQAKLGNAAAAAAWKKKQAAHP